MHFTFPVPLQTSHFAIRISFDRFRILTHLISNHLIAYVLAGLTICNSDLNLRASILGSHKHEGILFKVGVYVVT